MKEQPKGDTPDFTEDELVAADAAWDKLAKELSDTRPNDLGDEEEPELEDKP